MVATANELSTLAMFDGCTATELERVASALAGPREIPEGNLVCREGDTADRWWIVREGLADVTVRGLYIATIGPGETIGELALLDGEPRNATVTATTDMVLEEVDGAGFVEALLDSPRLALGLLRQLAVRLRRANDLSAGPAPEAVTASAAPAAATAGPVEYNPYAPGYFANPYEQLAMLREHEPVQLSAASKSGPTADAIDLTRPGANEHVSFGGGAHFCLGAALARLEAQIALPQLVRRFPQMQPAYDEPAWGRRMVLRGVERLPVTLHSA